MKTLTKIIMGAAMLAMVACSENSASASDSVKKSDKASRTYKDTEECKSICDSDAELCADVCSENPVDDSRDDAGSVGGCYSPCPPDAEICVDVCAEQPYSENVQ